MIITCPKCSMEKEAHPIDKHMCVDCANAANNRLTYYRRHQGDWIAEAKEQGLAPWLQQPGETQWEYTVWAAYRDSYPGKKPTYAAVAEQLCSTYHVVSKISQRWSFPARMQLWMAECDRITMLQRKEEILAMNLDHVNMAAKLRMKLNTAIDAIEPLTLKPAEIASLAKLSAEMERKARIDTEAQEEIRRSLIVDNSNPELKKQATKQSDMSEIVQILLKAGALSSVTSVGIKETTTREIVAHDGEGNSSMLVQGDD